MFTVDPPKTLADRKDGKHKGQTALYGGNPFCPCSHPAVFSGAQQKVKRKISLRSLRLCGEKNYFSQPKSITMLGREDPTNNLVWYCYELTAGM